MSNKQRRESAAKNSCVTAYALQCCKFAVDPLTDILQQDGRYRVNLEYCGAPHLQHVVRFMGDAVAFCTSAALARIKLRQHFKSLHSTITQERSLP